jgi:hypothetical protein
MATLSIPNVFANATVADATQVNANFNAVKSFVETYAVSTDGAVKATTASITDGAVTTIKIADGAITAAKLSGGAVGTSFIADSAVTTAKIADANVTTAKIADGAITGGTAGAGVKIAATTITNANISNSAAIALSKLATGALPTAITIAADNITSNAVTTAKINADAVTTAKIADDAVTGAKIAGTAALIVASVQTSGNIQVGGYIRSSKNTNNDYFEIVNSANDPIVRIDSNQGVYGDDQGTSGIRAVFARSDNRIGFSSSSRRFKQEISEHEFNEDAVRSMVPVRFKYIKDVEQNGSAAGWNYGFIAEEALDSGLPELVQFDSEGQVEYFAYERMCVAQQQLIRTLFDKVEALEAKVVELEGK